MVAAYGGAGSRLAGDEEGKRGVASTEEMRQSYPEPVIGVGADGHPVCDHSIGVLVAFPTTLTGSGDLELLVHPAQVAAWRAFATVMRRMDYVIFDPRTGTAACRNIDDAPFGRTSLHAHLSAIDLNPSANTGGATDQPPELQAALRRIATNRGDAAFRNLTTDRMHWQIDCTRASLATGIDPATITDPPPTTTEDELMMDRATWRRVQEALQRLSPPLYGGQPIDGIPGRNTNAAVRAFERRVGLTQRGVMGPLLDPEAGIWPATREMLFAATVPSP